MVFDKTNFVNLLTPIDNAEAAYTLLKNRTERITDGNIFPGLEILQPSATEKPANSPTDPVAASIRDAIERLASLPPEANDVSSQPGLDRNTNISRIIDPNTGIT